MFNFSFIDRGKNIMSPEINFNVVDELRQERKIVMVINDKNVDEYIDLNITNIDLYDPSSYSHMD